MGEIAQIIKHAGTIVWNGPLVCSSLISSPWNASVVAAIAESTGFSIAAEGHDSCSTKFGVTDNDYISTRRSFLEF